MPHAPDARQQGQPAPGDRLATALRRMRWPVVIVWVLAAVLLYSSAGHLSRVTNDSAAANLPSSAQSTEVASLQQSARTGQLQSGQNQAGTDQAVVVFARGNGRLTRRHRPGRHLRRPHPAPLRPHHPGRDRGRRRRPARHPPRPHHPHPRQPARHRRTSLVARPGRQTPAPRPPPARTAAHASRTHRRSEPGPWPGGPLLR